MISSKRISVFFVVAAVILAAVALAAYASHSWGGYHWARTANPFTLKVGDNVSTAWDSYFATTTSDWSVSSVLDLLPVEGGTNPKNCRPVAGRVEVCSGKYGNNGWLGIASIWVNGAHITQGTTRVNDTYFNTKKYNTPAWRNLVMCQEVGHTLGLDHQDENFSNTPLGTCMDYSSDPTLNQHPNQHDYDMLEEIYAHLDTTTTVGQAVQNGRADVDLDEPSAWGRVIKKSKDGRASLYVRELGRGQKVFTYVFWAD